MLKGEVRTSTRIELSVPLGLTPIIHTARLIPMTGSSSHADAVPLHSPLIDIFGRAHSRPGSYPVIATLSALRLRQTQSDKTGRNTQGGPRSVVDNQRLT